MILEQTPPGILRDEDAEWMQQNLASAPPERMALAQAKLNEWHVFRQQHPTPEMQARKDAEEQSVLGLYESPDKADFGPMVRALPGPEQAKVKQRVANEYFLGHVTGKGRDAYVDSMSYAAERGRIAGQMFDGRGADSDEGFAKEVSGYLIDRKETRIIMDDAWKQGSKSALTLEPNDTIADLQAIQKAGKTPDQGSKAMAAYVQARAAMEAKAGPYRPLAKTVRQLLENKVAKLGVDEGDEASTGDEDFNMAVDLLADVPDDALPHVVAMIQSKEAATDKDGVEKTGQSVARGLIGQLRGIASNSRRREIMRVRDDLKGDFLIPDGVTPEVAFKIRTGVSGLDILGPMMPGTRRATDEEKAAIGKIAEKELNRNVFAGKVMGILEGSVDPITSDSMAVRSIYGAANSIGAMVPAFIPYAGLVIQQGAFADQEFNRQIGMGTDVETAHSMAQVTGAVQAGLDRVQALFAIKLPGLGKAMSLKATAPIASNVAAQIGTGVLGVQAAEYAVESAQDAVPILTAALAGPLGWDLPEQAQYAEEMKRWKVWNPEMFMTLLPLSLIGGSYQGIQNTAQAKAELADPVKLQAVGIEPGEAARIAALPEAERLGAYKEAYAKRDPSTDAAGVAQEVIAARTAAQIKQGEQELRAMEEGGIVIERTAEGWNVTDKETGAVVSHPMAESAMQTARQVMMERGIRKEETFLDSLGEFAGLMKPGRSIEVTSRTSTLLQELEQAAADQKPLNVKAIWDRADDYRASVGQDALTRDMEDPDSRNALEGLYVLGRSVTEVQNNAAKSISLIFQGGGTLDLVEEQAENDLREAVANKRTSLSTMRGILKRIEKATGDKYLNTDTETGIVEAWSKVVRLYATGTKKEGNKVTAGARKETAADLRSERRRLRQAEAQGIAPAGFAKMREYYDQLRAMLGQVARLMKAKGEGKLEDLESMIRESVGLSEQDAADTSLADEVEQYVPPTPEQEAGGMAFSLSRRVHPTDYPESAHKVVASTNVSTLTKALLKEGEALVPLDESKANPMMVSPAYRAAKRGGDKRSAWEIANLFISGKRLAEYAAALEGKTPVFVPVRQREVERMNLLPIAAAWALQKSLKRGRVAGTVYQLKKGGNTGATTSERGSKEHDFSGVLDLEPGETVVLVDDTFTSGSTLAALYDYLHEQGVAAEHIFTMASGRYGKDMAASPERQKAAIDKIGVSVAEFESVTGTKISNFTGAELQAYLLNGKPGIAGFLDRFDAGGIAGGGRVFRGTGSGIGPTNSIAPVARLEAVMARLDNAMAKDPEARRKLGVAAAAKLAELRTRWTTERQTWKGDRIRPLTERRPRASLDKEQAFREAVATAEAEDQVWGSLSPDAQAAMGMTSDDTSAYAGPLAQRFAGGKFGTRGRIMGKTQALRAADAGSYTMGGEYDGAAGLPPMFFGGSITPDLAAQEAFEAGEISEATADALWDALRSELQTQAKNKEALKAAESAFKDAQKQARNKARESAFEWRKEEDAKQSKDYSPKAALLRDLRTLDAILSVMPAEIRGKVGGFVKLATLSTDKARAEEITRRIDKLSDIVEKHLRKEATEAIAKLMEKARADAKPGEKSKGKLGAETHAWFDRVAAAMAMNQDQATVRMDEIEGRMLNPDLTSDEQIELSEEYAQLATFSGMELRDAGELTDILDTIEEAYLQGREGWKMVAEARRAQWAEERKLGIAEVGMTNSISDQLKGGAKRAANWFVTGLDNLLPGTYEMALQRIFGRESQTAARLTQRAREATRAERDAVLAKEAAFDEALAMILPFKNKPRFQRKVARNRWLDAFLEPQQGKATLREGVKATTVKVPVETFGKIIAGEVDAKTFGLTRNDVDRLTQVFDALPFDSRKESLEFERYTGGVEKPAAFSEAEAARLLAMWGQESYRDGMRLAGIDEQTIDDLEAMMSPEGRDLMEFILKDLADGWKPTNAVFQRMEGVRLPRIKNYFPGLFETNGDTRAMELEGSGVQNGNLTSGHLRGRKQHKAAPKIDGEHHSINLLSVYWNHVAQNEHWKAWAEVVRDTKQVIANKEVSGAIEAAHGLAARKDMMAWINNHENGGLVSGYENLQMGRLMRRWMRARAQVKLALRLPVLAIQATGSLTSLLDLPFMEGMRSIARVATWRGELGVKAAYAHPVIQRRIKSGATPALRIAKTAKAGQQGGYIANALQMSMEPIARADGAFTAIAAAAAYDAHHRMATKAGASPEDAAAIANERMQATIERTAQPAEAMEKSLMENSSNLWFRALTMFSSDPRQKVALELAALRHALRGDGKWKDAGRMFLFNHIVLGSMAWVIRGILNDMLKDTDDEDEEGTDAAWELENWTLAVLLGPFSGLPILGDAIAYTANEFAGMRNFGDDTVIVEALSDVASIKQLANDPPVGEEAEAYWRILSRTLKGIGQGVGGDAAIIGVAANIADQLGGAWDNQRTTEMEAGRNQLEKEARDEKEKKGDPTPEYKAAKKAEKAAKINAAAGRASQ